MVKAHLVSSEDRQGDKNNPNRGGSKNRYLFRTLDGINPSPNGGYCLYKNVDGFHDGREKTGKTRPEIAGVDRKFLYLIEWYDQTYISSI